MTTISTRAKNLINNPSPIVANAIRCYMDPYSDSNPSGYLNFGVAQNFLQEQRIVDYINSSHTFNKNDIHYNASYGKYELREAFSNFADQYLGVSNIDPDLVCVQTGLTSICESLSFCLFNEGDTLLMPAPYYSGFIHDFSTRFKVNIEFIELTPQNDFKHNIHEFKKRIDQTRPKAILITHPFNPTGESLSDDFNKELIAYCKEKDIHIISDEIYALSRHNHQKHKSLFNYNYEKVHLLYGMAKDFSLAGLKTGFFYTKDSELNKAMQDISYFYTTSTQTQNSVTKLLNDTKFINSFKLDNENLIRSTYHKIITELPNLKHTKPDAGIFFLADLSHLLSEHSQEGEIELYNYIMDNIKINITPGHCMGMKNYGYFRVCYAQEENKVEQFIKRMRKILT